MKGAGTLERGSDLFSKGALGEGGKTTSQEEG